MTPQKFGGIPLEELKKLCDAGRDSKLSDEGERTVAIGKVFSALPDLLAALEAAQKRVQELEVILRDLRDPDDCSYDHHGHCQAHGWLDKGTCPQWRLKNIVAAVKQELAAPPTVSEMEIDTIIPAKEGAGQ